MEGSTAPEFRGRGGAKLGKEAAVRQSDKPYVLH